MNPVVFVTRKLPEAVEDRLRRDYAPRLNPDDRPYGADELVERSAGAAAILTCATDAWPAAVIERLPDSVRAIATFSAGYEHIDLAAASARGITITNTPDVLTEATADLAMLCLLGAARRAFEGEALIRTDRWTGWTPTQLLGVELNGATLGIVGMGRIGTAVARRARGFGLAIHYHNRRRVREELENELEATYWESLDQMLARMDMISVNCPHTPATFHLLSARRLKLLRPQAIIVNTSRGEVIDEAALTRMLRNHELAGAGLDVFEHEPAINPKLRELDNVVLLPHMGSATIEGRMDMGEKVVINIKTFIDGHRPPDRVLPSML